MPNPTRHQDSRRCSTQSRNGMESANRGEGRAEGNRLSYSTSPSHLGDNTQPDFEGRYTTVENILERLPETLRGHQPLKRVDVSWVRQHRWNEMVSSFVWYHLGILHRRRFLSDQCTTWMARLSRRQCTKPCSTPQRCVLPSVTDFGNLNMQF